MDKFMLAELKGRKFFQGWVSQEKELKIVGFNGDKYGHWDVAMEDSNKIRIVGEIKYRENSWMSYSDWLLEDFKYQELLKMKEQGYRIWYINIFNDGELCIWDLTDLDVGTKQNVMCNKTTAVKSGKRNKAVYFLNPDTAKYKTFNKDGGDDRDIEI